MEFPVVPRANHVITIQPALTQRAAGVIANAGDHTEDPVAMRDGQFRPAKSDFSEWARSEICDRADVLPLIISHNLE